MTNERWRQLGGPVSRFEPFRDLAGVQQEVNRLFDSFFGRPATVSTGERMWVPVCDMYETKDDLHVTFELPGVREKDIHLNIQGDLLTLKGERKWETEVPDEGYHRLERVYGKFERTVALPVPVQGDKVKATYRDGVLAITLPKAEEVKPKQVKIDIL